LSNLYIVKTWFSKFFFQTHNVHSYAVGPARPPVPTAIELFAPLTAAARQTESDRETLRVAAELQELVSNLTGGSGGGSGGRGSGGEGVSVAARSDAGGEAASWIEVPVFGEVGTPYSCSIQRTHSARVKAPGDPTLEPPEL
jgi:hypothetical protein